MQKNKKRDAEKTARVVKIARISKLSTDTVYKVLKGDRENNKVLEAYMMYAEGENKLLEAVKQMVPFN